MMNVLDYLKEIGVPCEVTLKYYHFRTLTDTVNIYLNEQPDKPMMNVFKKTSDSYQMMIKVGNMVMSMSKYKTKHNQKVFEDIKWYVKKNYSEYITNHQRSTKLKDTLGDPTPPKLI